MNMGMAFNRRPNKAPPSRMGGMSFKRFARQMGMEPEELGDEAENMWSMLDDSRGSLGPVDRPLIKNSSADKKCMGHNILKLQTCRFEVFLDWWFTTNSKTVPEACILMCRHSCAACEAKANVAFLPA